MILTLRGRIEEEQFAELHELLDAEGEGAKAFDLEEVRLVDRQIVRFLAHRQNRGVALRNCPSYVREWMAKRSDEQ
jgi:hypothetical protein